MGPDEMIPLRIATRGSPLALWQANHVRDLLLPLVAPRGVELIILKTAGDVDQKSSLSKIGGTGLFTKEIQNAVLDGRADLAVHSLKDLPTLPTAGLTLTSVPQRAPVHDAFLSRRWTGFEQLPQCATVATGSPRRRALLLHRRRDLKVVELRGNLDTRLKKLDEPGVDAIILAEAGLARLGYGDMIRERLSTDWMLPAVGQGALGIECRDADAELRTILVRLIHPPSWYAVRAERAFLGAFQAGCSVPLAALAVVTDGEIYLRGTVIARDGDVRLDVHGNADVSEAEALGRRLAENLLQQGARALLEQ